MAVTIDGTAGITFPVTAGSASAVQASSGRVLQVVQGTASGISTTSASFVTTGLAASITPSASTSKIFIMACLGDVYNGSVAQAATFTIYRGGTNIAPNGSGVNQAFAYYWTNASGPFQTSLAFNYLDSPSTTSSTTYTVYCTTQGGTLYTSINGQVCTIQLMEISA